MQSNVCKKNTQQYSPDEEKGVNKQTAMRVEWNMCIELSNHMVNSSEKREDMRKIDDKEYNLVQLHLYIYSCLGNLAFYFYYHVGQIVRFVIKHRFHPPITIGSSAADKYSSDWFTGLYPWYTFSATVASEITRDDEAKDESDDESLALQSSRRVCIMEDTFFGNFIFAWQMKFQNSN